MKNKKLYIHVDIDSPIVLSKFYGDKNPKFNINELEAFYELTINRALELFNEFDIKATFFCVGEEIEKSDKIKRLIQKLFVEGHEIANHTYSHPYGLCNHEKKIIKQEIQRCNEIIESITQKKVKGFRAPGYAIKNNVIEVLNELDFTYDSSAGWPLLHWSSIPLKLFYRINKKNIKIGYGETNWLLNKEPYNCSKKDWKKKDPYEKYIFEIPLPHSFGIIPFYNNLLLGLSLPLQNILINNINSTKLVYLMHLIEFTSINDQELPKNILNHPHIKKKYKIKSDNMRNILENLCKEYQKSNTYNDY